MESAADVLNAVQPVSIYREKQSIYRICTVLAVNLIFVMKQEKWEENKFEMQREMRWIHLK